MWDFIVTNAGVVLMTNAIAEEVFTKKIGMALVVTVVVSAIVMIVATLKMEYVSIVNKKLMKI